MSHLSPSQTTVALNAALELFRQVDQLIATSNLPAPSNAELGALIDNALNTVKNTLATLTLDEAINVLRHELKQQGARTASELQALEAGFLGLFNILASSIIDSAPGAMCDVSSTTFLK
ncbi:MAG: hypothetical protein K2Q15_16920 [Burkholderiales bacterium]|jgi:hypothetical protein|nr:hypothetical protein [Burkholderiales bacterium]